MNKISSLTEYKIKKENAEALINNKINALGANYYKKAVEGKPLNIPNDRVKKILKTLGLVSFICLNACAIEHGGFTVGTPSALAVLQNTKNLKIHSNENRLSVAAVSEEEKKDVIINQLAVRSPESVNEHTRTAVDNYLMLKAAQASRNNYSGGMRHVKFDKNK